MIEVTLSPRILGVGRKSEVTVRLANTGARACTDLVFRLGLPDGLVLLGGARRVEVRRLEPGASETWTVQIRAKTAGPHRVTSPNFCYADCYGVTHHQTGFAFLLEAVADRAPGPAESLAAEPALTLETTELPSGQEAVLRGRVANTGGADFLSVVISLADPAVEQCGPDCRIGALPVGRQAPFALRVRFPPDDADSPPPICMPRWTAITPVRASSVIVYGFISSTNASILSSGPASSTVRLSGATSTTLPRKRFTISMTSPRLSPVTPTVINARSRSM